jgi:hypothetical protein
MELFCSKKCITEPVDMASGLENVFMIAMIAGAALAGGLSADLRKA